MIDLVRLEAETLRAKWRSKKIRAEELLRMPDIRRTVKCCNLTYANEHRPAALFTEIAIVLM